MVMRMLVVMCASCPDLAVVLLKQNIADTLAYLLVGSAPDTAPEPSSEDSASLDSAPSAPVELVSRTPQELYEIVSLIG